MCSVLAVADSDVSGWVVLYKHKEVKGLSAPTPRLNVQYYLMLLAGKENAGLNKLIYKSVRQNS